MISSGKLSSDVWQVNATYGVPELKSNPYVGGAIVFPASDFAGGDGSVDKPYQVANAEQFAKIIDFADAYFIQTENFEISAPLMFTSTKPFKGNYNGNGKTIVVNITEYTGDPLEYSATTGGVTRKVPTFGIFRVLSGKIENLTIDGTIGSPSNRIEAERVGAFAGVMNSYSEIDNCTNKADIYVATEGNLGGEVAGFAGRAYSSGTSITNCKNYGEINAAKASAFAGVIYHNSTLENCVNYGPIYGTTIAAGVIAWSYGDVVNCANFGTVTSTTRAVGVAGSISTDKNNTDGVFITNCFNAGTLNAPNTIGVAYRTTDIALTVENCYNLVYADDPIHVDSKEYTATVTLTKNYYLTGDGNDEGAEGATPYTQRAVMREADLGDAYSIVTGYYFPTSVALDLKEIADYGASKVSVSVPDDNVAVSVTNFTTDHGFFVAKGFDGLKIVVDPEDGFYEASVAVNDVTIAEGIRNLGDTVAITVSEDTRIDVAVESVESNLEDLPTVATINDTCANIVDEPITYGNATFNKYALIAGTAPVAFGFKLKEYGVIVGHSEYISINYNENETYEWGVEGYARPYAFKATITDLNKMNADYKYGTLLYGDNLEENGTYYVRAYAVYEDSFGGTHMLEGDVTLFTVAKAEN